MADEWGWWSGSSDEHFSCGPCDTKAEAVAEALAQDAIYEDEREGGVIVDLVHVIEAKGTHYDCEECGTVPEACAECKSCLYPEECASKFTHVRNADCVEVGRGKIGEPRTT